MHTQIANARNTSRSSGSLPALRLPKVLIGLGLLAASSFCQGCLVLPVRAPTRTHGNSGAMEKVNLDFIQAGKTTREEVTEKLGATDTGVKDERLFLGRWATSKWGVLWGVAGNNYAAGGWNRAWARHNILITFDDHGVVQQFHKFPDQELVQQLFVCVRQGQSQPLDLSAPIQVPVEHRHSSGRDSSGVFLLGNDSFEFREDGDHAKHSFKISPEQIKELSLTTIGHGDKSDPRYMNQTLHFKEKTKVGRNMTIRVDLPTVMILVKYLAVGRPSIR